MPVANCPVCGKGPMTYPYTYIPFAYECCGVKCYSIEKWNRYAAAMELARAVLRLYTDDSKTAHQWEFFVEEAEKRVLEVFNGTNK